ncbi:MAG: hypothetical protein ACRC9R_07935 [Enterovibrio sp.]
MSKYKLFQWCPVQCKVVPIHEVAKRSPDARDLFIQDEMEPTRNPLNPREVYTSKAKLRAAYRSAGAIEVGDAYERGYDPRKDDSKNTDKIASKVMQQIKERMNG